MPPRSPFECRFALKISLRLLPSSDREKKRLPDRNWIQTLRKI